MTVSYSRYGVLLLLLSLMTACSTTPIHPPVEDRGAKAEPTPKAAPPPSVEAEPVIVTPLPDIATPPPAIQQPTTSPQASVQTTQSPAVLALLSDAEQSRSSGDYRAAQGSLQRAQRIAPRDPAVYYSLALTHLELEDFSLAEQVALKGVTVAQGNAEQLQRLWDLIARIRLRDGDPSGSREAADKAASYR